MRLSSLIDLSLWMGALSHATGWPRDTRSPASTRTPSSVPAKADRTSVSPTSPKRSPTSIMRGVPDRPAPPGRNSLQAFRRLEEADRGRYDEPFGHLEALARRRRRDGAACEDLHEASQIVRGCDRYPDRVGRRRHAPQQAG